MTIVIINWSAVIFLMIWLFRLVYKLSENFEKCLLKFPRTQDNVFKCLLLKIFSLRWYEKSETQQILTTEKLQPENGLNQLLK